jgi:hypothetical protein
MYTCVSTRNQWEPTPEQYRSFSTGDLAYLSRKHEALRREQQLGSLGRFIEDGPYLVKAFYLMVTDQVYPGNRRPSEFTHGPLLYSYSILLLALGGVATLFVVVCLVKDSIH